ncbi:hypothetical protein I6E29_03500 [Arcanobacterium haemolyticum]|nr:hypothetical protein [Arcanobacterium haemolyticum]
MSEKTRVSGVSARVRMIIAAVIAVFVIAGTVFALPNGKADAAVTSRDPKGLGRVGLYITGPTGWSTWLGTEPTRAESNGEPSWCVQIMADTPLPSQQVSVSTLTESTPHIAGFDLSTPQMAHLLGTYGKTSDSYTAAALAFLVHANFETGAENISQVRATLTDIRSVVSNLENRIRELRTEAINSAAVGYEKCAATGDMQRKGQINNVGVKNGNGAWIAGTPMTVQLAGPAVFDATGTDTWTGTSEASPFTLTWRATGNGEVTYRFTAKQPVRRTLTKYGASGKVQDSISYGNRDLRNDPEEITVPGDTWRVVYDFQPVVSSQVEAQFVAAGGVFSDEIMMQADPNYGSGQWLTLDDGSFVPVSSVTSLYYVGLDPVSVSDEVPAGAELVGEAPLTFAGPGSQKIAFDVTRPGYYVAKTLAAKDAQGEYAEYVHSDATYQFGVENETSIARIKPTITTQASDKLVVPGQQTSDKVTVRLNEGASWADGLTIKAHGTLYGPFDTPQPQSDSAPEGAPVAATADLTFTSDGQTLEAPWMVPDYGFYTWVWDIRAENQEHPIVFDGDFVDDFMITVETTSVRVPTFGHYSQSREYNVDADGRAFDTITISGYMDSHTDFEGLAGYWAPDVDEATVTVYDAGVGRDWKNAGPEVPEDAVVHWQGTVPAVNGRFDIGYEDGDPITGFTPGHDYVFVYHFPGDDRVAPYTSAFNDIRERFHVPGDTPDKPEVVTQATKRVLVGQDFTDTALVTGDVPAGSYLVFEAFGPHSDESRPRCDDPFFTSEKIMVDRADYHESGPARVDSAGQVYWIETLYGKDGTVISRGECGIPSETTEVVPYEPEIHTKAHADNENQVGGAIWDTLTATWKKPVGFTDTADPAVTPWPYPAGSITTVDLYYAAPGQVLTCETPIWSDTITLIEGQSEYETGRYTVDKAGTYGFVETTRDPDGTVISIGLCGDPDETVTIEEPPTPPTETPSTPPSETPSTPPADRPSSPPHELAYTGSSTATLMLVVALFLVCGAGIVIIRHR